MSGAKEETPLLRSKVYPPNTLSASSLPALSLLLQSFFEEHCRETLQGHIWQREAPKVSVDATDKHDAHLVVTMRHGGSLEDEWLAVHLLLLATVDPRFSEQALLMTLEGKGSSPKQGGGLVIDVKDEDGQFLLIEAAEHLPSWVQPDNADGRVWLHEGNLHLISPKVHMGDVLEIGGSSNMEGSDARPVTSATAVNLIRSQAHNTLAPPTFKQAIVTQRMPSYPDLSWALYNQHSTLAYLPRSAAVALHKQPQLIADAAEAFEGREGPNDARHLREMKVFSPSRGESVVASETDVKESVDTSGELLVKVKLPRRLYASFLTPRYLPSKAFGESWRQEVSTYWEILEKATRGEDVTGRDEEKCRGRRRDLGCKIACGLELAYWTAKERSRGRHQDIFSSSNDEELRKSPLYASFIDALQRIDFFGSNIKDSREWKEREKKALGLWRKSQSLPADDEHTSDTLEQLLDITTTDTTSAISPPHFATSTSAQALALEEDPDAFMYDLPEQLKEAADRQSRNELQEDEAETEEERVAMSQVNAFADKLQSFVEGEGDMDGALFEDEDMESGEEDEDGDATTGSKKIDDLTKEEREEAMKNLVPALSLDEWGAKGGVSNGGAKPMKEEQSTKVEGTSATGFSRRVQYDGASDSEESVDDEILRAGDTEEDRMSRAKWLGIEREVEEDEDYRRRVKEDEGAEGYGEGGEEGGDFGQDELMSFIEFTRKELGLSEEQYEDILRKRRERGAYVPDLKSSMGGKGKKGKKVSFGGTAKEEPAVEPVELEREEQEETKAASHKTGQQIQAEKKKEREKALKNQRTTGEEKEAARRRAQQFVEDAEREAEQRQQRVTDAGSSTVKGKSESLNEDPFAKLMDAMDSELASHQERQAGKKSAASTNGEKGGGAGEEGEDSDDDMDLDEMSAEDAELLEKMLHSGPPASLRALLGKQNNPNDPSKLSSVEQEVMQSMLASYQAQLGGAGPAGALAGRLGIGPLLMNDDP